MDVRITQLDGKLPNLALMRLSAWHKSCGGRVHFSRSATRGLWEPDYGAVYGSAIFSGTSDRVARLQAEFPGAIIGGTGSGSAVTLDDIIPSQFHGVDYDLWPAFKASLGFTQRGCRLSCKFCVVPAKEGKPSAVASVYDIWRGEGHPKHLHLLDNDFFGQPEAQWRSRIEEIREGGFKVCWNQGLNVRFITDETAAAVASVEYRDDNFRDRVLYTAWDNLKDERVFFAGVDRLEAAGVPPKHIRAYMLVGFDKRETWARVLYRFNRMVERGIEPFPMVYGDRHRTLPLGETNLPLARKTLKQFQRWAITGLYRAGPFEEYSTRRLDLATRGHPDLFEAIA